MNPYPERIEELHYYLEARYGQKDRQATEILLAALLDPSLSLTRHPWIIIETDYPSRDTSDGWFSFGGTAAVHSLADARAVRPRIGEQLVLGWMKQKTCLFVESEWRRLPKGIGKGEKAHARVNWDSLVARCVRLRVDHPRGPYALSINRLNDQAELSRLTRRVLDNDLRDMDLSRRLASSSQVDRSGGGPVVPAGLLYWCELLQKISPWQSDWESLLCSLGAIARNIALLRQTDGTPGWAAAERVIRDSVGWTTGWILGQVTRGTPPRMIAGLGAAYEPNKQTFIREIARLRSLHIIQSNMKRTGFKVNKEFRDLTDRSVSILI